MAGIRTRSGFPTLPAPKVDPRLTPSGTATQSPAPPAPVDYDALTRQRQADNDARTAAANADNTRVNQQSTNNYWDSQANQDAINRSRYGDTIAAQDRDRVHNLGMVNGVPAEEWHRLQAETDAAMRLKYGGGGGSGSGGGGGGSGGGAGSGGPATLDNVLRSIEAVNNLAIPGGGGGGVDPAAQKAARDAAFARAKDTQGQLARASMDSLRGILSETGRLGGGYEDAAMSSVVNEAQGNLGEVNREQLLQELADINRNEDRGLTRRAQDLNYRQSLLGLINATLY